MPTANPTHDIIDMNFLKMELYVLYIGSHLLHLLYIDCLFSLTCVVVMPLLMLRTGPPHNATQFFEQQKEQHKLHKD